MEDDNDIDFEEEAEKLKHGSLLVVERPFDYLQELIDGEIEVKINTICDRNPVGKVLAFDSHNNLVIETEKGTQYIRGSNLQSIKTHWE